IEDETMTVYNDVFGARAKLQGVAENVIYYRLNALAEHGVTGLERLPFTVKIMLENVLRNVGGGLVNEDEVYSLARWVPGHAAQSEAEYPFLPARVLLQDFTGVPAVADLAAMRSAVARLQGDPKKINPLVPADLVIDHSVQVDTFGSTLAFARNVEREYERNSERYALLRWAQQAFSNFRVVPPGTGIVHQVNLEYLASVVMTRKENGATVAFPDTLVGTDSHTTMINGLGVLGWGVGGIEAEAAMLGQPVSMLIPQVVGVKLTGKLREGATATDLVLTITEMLRKHGVVGKFVEYYGPGLPELPLADRATIGNMSPEYGATCGIFPVDKETLSYLRLTGRSDEHIALIEAYCREQGLFHDEKTPEAQYSELLTLDLSTVEPSLAGPKRPQDRVPLSQAARSFHEALPSLTRPAKGGGATAALAAKHPVARQVGRWEGEGGNPTAVGVEDQEMPAAGTPISADLKRNLHNGSVVIAAITSCTNTSNPSVMIAAGLVAKKAVEHGLSVPGWVKSSLAPGSKVVRDYLERAGLQPYLDKLRFNVVGYGCT